MYTALKPKYFAAGQFTEYVRGQLTKVEYYKVAWEPLGTVKDMAEAKQRFGGSPVLEDVR